MSEDSNLVEEDISELLATRPEIEVKVRCDFKNVNDS